MAKKQSGSYYKLAAVLASLLAVYNLPAAKAEDVIVTQQQTHRGTVRAVTPDGIQLELPGRGVITIPRMAVVNLRVDAPPGITRGVSAYEHGNIREARQSLDRLVFQYQGLDMEWAIKGLLYFGHACLKLNETQTAAKAFEAFISAYPDEDQIVSARLGMAEITLLNKNYEKAAEDFRELAEPYAAQLKPPADQQAYAALANLGLGKALEAQQQPAEALDAYLKVIALYPDPAAYPEALYRAGVVFNSLGKYDKAERFLAELTEGYPQSDFAKQAESLLPVVAGKAREMNQD